MTFALVSEFHAYLLLPSVNAYLAECLNSVFNVREKAKRRPYQWLYNFKLREGLRKGSSPALTQTLTLTDRRQVFIFPSFWFWNCRLTENWTGPMESANIVLLLTKSHLWMKHLTAFAILHLLIWLHLPLSSKNWLSICMYCTHKLFMLSWTFAIKD